MAGEASAKFTNGQTVGTASPTPTHLKVDPDRALQVVVERIIREAQHQAAEMKEETKDNSVTTDIPT